MELIKIINNDIKINITDGIYLDKDNTLEIKDKYIKIYCQDDINILINKKPLIRKKDIYVNILENINSIYINGIAIELDFEQKNKDIDYLMNVNQTILYEYILDNETDLTKINMLKYKIGKIKKLCKKYNIIFHKELDDKILNILKKRKINNNEYEDYYLNEVNKIIKNYNIHENKLALSLINRNIDLYFKIFANLKKEINDVNSNLQIKQESLEQYFSPISHMNWLEVLQENQIMSLIIRTKPNSYFISNNNIDCVEILNITRSVIDMDMFFCFYNQYYNKHKRYDDGIGEPIFKGNGLGEGNCAIPLFIHPEHWKLAKQIIPIFTSIAVCGNPGLYIKNTINIYKKILIHMIAMTYIDNNIDEKWLNMLFCLWITTDKICNDTYSKDEFMKNPLYRIQIKSLSQIIYKILDDTDDDKNFNYLILEEIIRRKFNYLKYIENIVQDDILIDLAQNIKIYNKYLVACNLFRKMNYIKFEFEKNNYILSNEMLNIIKTNVAENRFYLIENDYYPVDKITKVYKDHFTQNQLDALILQCFIQKRDKNRVNAIKKDKYYNPFIDAEICIESCLSYLEKYIKYNNQKSIDELEKELDNDLNELEI